MPFPSVVNANPAPAVQGDFASQPPCASVLAGAGQLVVPPAPATINVGHFTFVNPTTGVVTQAYTSGQQIGFVGRHEQALITTYLGEQTLTLPPGFMLTLYDAGEFWCRFGAGATPGQTVYADVNSGRPVAGSATNTATASAGWTGTATFASGPTVVTIASTSAGQLSVGDTLTATNVPTGATITSFGTYTTTAGTGTVNISLATTGTGTAAAASTTSTNLIVTAILTGSLSPADPITGTGVTAGTLISAFGTGTGYTGQYVLSVAQNFASTTITATGGNVATGFKVRGTVTYNPGELGMISTFGV